MSYTLPGKKTFTVYLGARPSCISKGVKRHASRVIHQLVSDADVHSRHRSLQILKSYKIEPK